ncbi:MAG: glycosyltransferase [Gemmatimonadota bacterium]|nr:MAG: glycosyltransferase [Gemmatimonadota bacterium]
MTTVPRVSVLLPCRNAESTLREAVRSLVGQTYGDIEVIAVDDGSTDSTSHLLAAWNERDSRVRVVCTEARGIVATLNKAAATARGELLARMDADDVAAPQRFEKQVELLDATPALAACGTQVRYFPRDTVRDGARRYEEWVNSINTPKEIERDLFVECPLPHPTLLVRREAFERAGAYRDARWPEDYDLVLRLWRAGYRLGKVAEPLLDWREGPDRLSRTDARYSEAAFRRCKVTYLEHRIRNRPVVICGSGPVGKAFALELQHQGHHVVAFLDLDPRKIGQTIHGAPVVKPTAIRDYPQAYFLAAVASPESRSEIRTYLSEAGLCEIADFCAVA